MSQVNYNFTFQPENVGWDPTGNVINNSCYSSTPKINIINNSLFITNGYEFVFSISFWDSSNNYIGHYTNNTSPGFGNTRLGSKSSITLANNEIVIPNNAETFALNGLRSFCSAVDNSSHAQFLTVSLQYTEPVTPRIVKGQTVNYLSFDGVDDEVNLGNVFSDNNSYTLYGKFLFNTLHNGVIYSFAGSSDSRIRIQSSGVLNYAPFDGTVNNYLFSPVLSTNTIHQFVVIRDKSSGMSLYVNGVLVDSNNATGNANILNIQDAIGNHKIENPQFFNGNIYDIKLYNTVITNQQAIDLSSGQSISTTPFAHWNFSDGIGTTLTDVVGTNDGTIVGATWESEGTVQNMYLGSTVIPRAYLGGTLVFGTTPPSAYELIADINVATATTQIDFDNLNITKDDELRLVHTLVGDSSSVTTQYSLRANDITSNYHFQLLSGVGSSFIAVRDPSNIFINALSNQRSAGFADIKISNNDRFVVQAQSANRGIGADASGIRNYNFNLVNTSTISSITKLSVVANRTNGIAVGSKLQLYKVVK